MSNKTRLTKDSRRMDKLLRENGYEVVRKRGGHLIYEKDGVNFLHYSQLLCCFVLFQSQTAEQGFPAANHERSCSCYIGKRISERRA